MVDTWALNGLPCHDFEAYICTTIVVPRAFGSVFLRSLELWPQVGRRDLRTKWALTGFRVHIYLIRVAITSRKTLKDLDTCTASRHEP